MGATANIVSARRSIVNVMQWEQLVDSTANVSTARIRTATIRGLKVVGGRKLASQQTTTSLRFQSSLRPKLILVAIILMKKLSRRRNAILTLCCMTKLTKKLNSLESYHSISIFFIINQIFIFVYIMIKIYNQFLMCVNFSNRQMVLSICASIV